MKASLWFLGFVILLAWPSVGHTGPPAGVSMRGGRSSVVRPFEILDNRIFLEVRVNGRGPFKFILDSGSINVLTLETARRLELPLKRAGRQSGAGSGSVESWTTTIDSLTLGDLGMADQECLVLSLDPIIKAIGFERLDGVLGYELFRQLVVELDYQGRRVTFFQPEAHEAPLDSDTIPFVLHTHIPVVEGVVDGSKGQFFVDTGDRSSLTLFRPFVEKHDLLRRERLTPEVITGWGIGGPIPARVTRLGTLQIHRSSVQGVVTRFPTLTQGAFASSQFAGSVGTGVLKKFTVTFDYPNKRLFLKFTSNEARRDPWDGAGMWLVQSDGGFEVYSVMKGSPADLTGIEAGDVIVAVDGLDAKRRPLLDVRRILSDDHAGTTVHLELEKDGKVRVVELILEEIL